jgi:hypothetical protein
MKLELLAEAAPLRRWYELFDRTRATQWLSMGILSGEIVHATTSFDH